MPSGILILCFFKTLVWQKDFNFHSIFRLEYLGLHGNTIVFKFLKKSNAITDSKAIKIFEDKGIGVWPNAISLVGRKVFILCIIISSFQYNICSRPRVGTTITAEFNSNREAEEYCEHHGYDKTIWIEQSKHILNCKKLLLHWFFVCIFLTFFYYRS